LEIKDFLLQMDTVPHVSGYEGELAELLKTEFSKFCETSIDKFGNVIALKKGLGGGPKIMIAAHMDEIGMMVSAITEEGFVKFSRVGGIDKRNVLAQEVTIHGREKVFGIIGIKPPHLVKPDEQKKVIEFFDMAIDTGYSKEELEKLVRPGDIITFNTKMAELKGGKMTGRAMDDIVGIAVMYATMKNLEVMKHKADVYFVGTAQEEVGCRGAYTATYTIKPDYGIAVDVGFGRTPGLDESNSQELGKGPVLTVGPNVTRSVFEGLKKAAGKNHTPYQVEVSPGMTGTDAFYIQIGEGGVCTGVVSIPLKYMHSTNETVQLSDIDCGGKLIADYIMSLNCEEDEKCS
jgi:endoglucanase